MKTKIKIDHTYECEKPAFIFLDHYWKEILLFYTDKYEKMSDTVGVWRIKYKQN